MSCDFLPPRCIAAPAPPQFFIAGQDIVQSISTPEDQRRPLQLQGTVRDWTDSANTASLQSEYCFDSILNLDSIQILVLQLIQVLMCVVLV
jgi:hypothetical protein